MIRSVDLRQKEKQILDKVLGPTVYDRRIRPGSGNLTSSKKIHTDRILMLNRAWKGVRTCIVTENPLAFRFAFSHHKKVQVGVIIPIQRVYQMYPIRGIQLMSSYCKKKKLKENRIVKAKESIFYFFEKSAE